MKNIKRKLFLVAGEGIIGTRSYRKGVLVDIQNYKDYFMCPEGGAWNDDEIIIFQANDNPFSHTYFDTFWESLYKNGETLDYCVFIFCGHGTLNENNETCICPKASETYLLPIKRILSDLRGTRSLLVFDSCRGLWNDEELNESDNSRAYKMFSGDANYRSKCRALYDQEFKKMRIGNYIIGFATSKTHYANEDSKGGLYSQTLLQSAREYVKRGIVSVNNVVGFKEVHDKVTPIVFRKSGHRQIPELSMSSDGIDAPFVVLPEPKIQMVEIPVIKEHKLRRFS